MERAIPQLCESTLALREVVWNYTAPIGTAAAPVNWQKTISIITIINTITMIDYNWYEKKKIWSKVNTCKRWTNQRL